VRRALWVALIGSAAAAGWSLMSPGVAPTAGVVAAREDPAGVRSGSAVAKPLPLRWDAPVLEAARRSPFGADAQAVPVAKAVEPSPPKLVVAQPPPAAVVQPAALQVAIAPFTYRYVGRVVDPQGQRVIYVARGDTVVTVEQGTSLSEGYTVESISESSIEVVNTATKQRHTIAIPPDASATAAAGARTR
jgi:hypothetical protein